MFIVAVLAFIIVPLVIVAPDSLLVKVNGLGCSGKFVVNLYVPTSVGVNCV